MSTFYKILLLLVLTTQLPQVVFAQNEQLKDTLDWRGYYPLEIGNAWEWSTHMPNVWFGGDFNSVDHREIVADTMINDQNYFVQVAYSASEFEATEERNELVWREYLRYDTLQTSVVQFDLNQGGEYSYTCDLSADFNGVGACDEEFGMGTEGGYASDDDFQVVVGSDYAPYHAVKSYVGLSGGTRFFHGIGSFPVFGDGGGGTITFTYVKVGNTAYGARSIRVSVEEAVQYGESTIEIYPNPVKSRLYLVAPRGLLGIKARIIDVLGRSAPVILICEEKRCHLDVSTLKAGIYVLEYSSTSQVYGSRMFVVAR